MKQHEREYFISRIRLGYYPVKIDNVTLKIYTPTIQDDFEMNQIYQDAYDQAVHDDIKTEEEVLSWMREKELWTADDDKKTDGIKKDIETLKVKIFENRFNSQLKESARAYLRRAESELIKLHHKKNIYFSNTCESIAVLEKSFAMLKKCTYVGNELYSFEDIPMDYVLSKYYDLFLNESKIRELSRNDPWRSLWILNEKDVLNLFLNKDRELSNDQKNLMVWSKMYDNVHESLDCPSDEVIEDDDMLDGWFIVQRRKRETEKSQSEIDSTIKNSKIKNSSEVMIMAQSKEDAQKINDMNDLEAKIIKKQREAVIKSRGEASQTDFKDEKIKLAERSNEMYRDKFRR